MSSKSYIPAGDAKFLEWAKTFSAYAKIHAIRWKVAPPDDDYTDLIGDFEHNLGKATEPNRGKIDTLKKNESRKALEKASRVFVQGFLAKNPYVNNADREAMGLTIYYDVIPTPVGKPTGVPTLATTYDKNGRIKLQIRVVDDATDKRANYGIKIYYGIFPQEAQPASVNDLSENRFTRQKSLLFSFPATDKGKKLFICARCENSKGDAGDWGEIIAATIT
jgi:hypothetical protein